MLIYCDSFDHYGTGTVLGTKGWATTQSVSTTWGITASGRTGPNCLYNPSSGSGTRSCTKTLPGSYGSFVTGFALNTSVAARTIWTFKESGTVHIDIRMDATGHLFVTRNGTQIGSTGTTIVGGTGWRYIELKATIHDTTGSFELRIDGVTEITFSGGDTRNGGSGVVNQIGSATAGSDNFFLDDLYFCDLTGSTNNDFLGDIGVYAVYPNGNGNSSQLVGSDANSTDNYLLVDETSPNSDTDYVESSTVGDKDTYAMGDLSPTAGTVYGMQINAYAKKTDAGTRSIVTVTRLSGTEEDSAAQTLASSYGYLSDIRETKPGGGAWTISDVNSMEVGVKVNA